MALDDREYQEKQGEEFRRYEAVCKRCGRCCGAFDGDPCANLACGPDGLYFCKDYENRIGPQKTLSGKTFRCIPIRDLYSGVAPFEGCAYGVTGL